MWYLYGLTVLAGFANAVQPGQNATLAKSVGVLVAGLVVLAVSLFAFLLGGIAVGKLEWPSLKQMAEVPWWAWLGGPLSALVILAQLYVPSTIGAAAFLGIIVTVGIVASMVLDNYGWVGFPVHPLGIWRAVGAGLMVIGVVLVARF